MIRIATKEDFDGINLVIIANRSSDDIYKYPGTFGDSRDIISRKDQIIFISILNEEVIGFLSLHNSNLYKIGCKAEFEIVVHPTRRNREKHYGENLLRYAINYVEKQTKICVLEARVMTNNEKSINLLRKLEFDGFPNENTDNGFIMKLNITR